MTNFNEVVSLKNEIRDALFARFPQPTCKPRRVYRNVSAFCANHIEGDARGGESGHASVAIENAYKSLKKIEAMVHAA